ncbi:MAG: YCF48-related protein [Candidatus Moranbacteria bacterium]|nr:YCF48-related protein [Candidatus Moranbacteria bacterium]
MRKHLLTLLFLIPFLAGCSFSAPPSAGSIWKSTDGGKTWAVKNKKTETVDFSQVDVLSLAVNPFDSKKVYAGTINNGIIKSEDGGETWSATSFTSKKVYGLEINPADGKIIYASGVWNEQGKIFKSSDGGENWAEIYASPASGPLVISLTIDQKNPNIIFASTSDNQLIKSEDGGNSWKNILNGNSPILKVAIDRSDDNLIYFTAGSQGVFRSRDGGKNFENISEIIRKSFAKSGEFFLAVTDPANSGWIYLTGRAGIILSQDEGDTWKEIRSISPADKYPVRALAINPANSNEIIYGAAQAVYKSVDGGNNWATSQFDAAKIISILRYDPSNPSAVYAGFGKLPDVR